MKAERSRTLATNTVPVNLLHVLRAGTVPMPMLTRTSVLIHTPQAKEVRQQLADIMTHAAHLAPLPALPNANTHVHANPHAPGQGGAAAAGRHHDAERPGRHQRRQRLGHCAQGRVLRLLPGEGHT